MSIQLKRTLVKNNENRGRNHTDHTCVKTMFSLFFWSYFKNSKDSKLILKTCSSTNFKPFDSNILHKGVYVVYYGKVMAYSHTAWAGPVLGKFKLTLCASFHTAVSVS